MISVSRAAESSERSAFAYLRTIGILIVLGFALWPQVASAQPMFTTEHDWTITIGEKTFGLRQHLETTGGLRSTEIFLGWYDFHTQWPAPQIVTAAMLLVIGGMGLVLWRERRYWLWSSPKPPADV